MPRDIRGTAEHGAQSAGSGPTVPAATIADEPLLWLLGSLCGLHQIAFDPALLRTRFPGAHNQDSLPAVLAHYGLAATAVRPADLDGAGGRVCIAFLKAEPPDAAPQPVILSAVAPDQITYFAYQQAQPTVVARSDFLALLAGPLLQIRPTLAEPTDPDAVAKRPKFSFRWFVPELLKHKRLWRNVLAASLVIQLLALGTPLITQAIIDKVIVHRTESTLIALGIGLAVFLVFSSALSWVRQYLVLHTGMRVDAVLGATVFKHLVELPPRYFQMRPTGVIAARLHGVEQIRDFLASAAVALVLDLPFLSVALALMFWYSVPLTLLAAGFLVAIVIASLIVSPLFQSRLNREFLLGARNQAFVTEYVAGMETVKSLQMEP